MARDPEKYTKVILEIEKDLKQRAIVYAEDEDKTLSAFIRAAIREKIRRIQKAKSANRTEADIFGDYEGGEDDV